MATAQNTIVFTVLLNDYSFGFNGQVMSLNEMRMDFLWGIPICNPVTGQALSPSTYLQKLTAAQDYVSNMCDLKIFKQYVGETKPFVRDEYMNWGFVKTSWMVNTPFYLTGTLNGQPVLRFPNEWVTTVRKNLKDYTFGKAMYFVPNGQGTAVSFAYNFTINNLYAFYGSRIIPEYWYAEYVTGFEIIPPSIINVIGKYAALQLLPVIEMTVVSGGGYTFGSASNSLSLDGMSQNVSKANGGNIFKQRMEQYSRELNGDGRQKGEIEQLRTIFSGFELDVV